MQAHVDVSPGQLADAMLQSKTTFVKGGYPERLQLASPAGKCAYFFGVGPVFRVGLPVENGGADLPLVQGEAPYPISLGPFRFEHFIIYIFWGAQNCFRVPASLKNRSFGSW